MIRPSLLSACSRSTNADDAPSSSPVNGSSRSNNRGSCSRVRSSATRCRIPRENPPMKSSPRDDKPACRSALLDRSLTWSKTVKLRKEFKVFPGGQFRIELKLMTKQADVSTKRWAPLPVPTDRYIECVRSKVRASWPLEQEASISRHHSPPRNPRTSPVPHSSGHMC